MNRTILTAVAAIAGLGALSGIGFTSVASAAPPISDTVSVVPVSGVAEMVNDGRFWKSVEGFKADGSGGDTSGGCQEFAEGINYAGSMAHSFEGYGPAYAEQAASWNQKAEDLEDRALDAGCVILYT